VPESTIVPVVQLVPPTRTLKVPFSFACQVMVVPPLVGLGRTESIVTVGAVLSRVKVAAVPVKVLPALSFVVAWTVYVPSAWPDHVGRVVLLVQVAVVLPEVGDGVWVVARLVFREPEATKIVPFQ